MKHTSLICLTVLSIGLAGPSFANKSLWEYDRISKGLFDMAVANEIGKRCTSIGTRKLRGLSFAQGLFSYAKSEGYSYSEVKAFIEDDTQKAKLKSRVVPYLKAQGVDLNKNETFCPLGKREIKKKSQIGLLLND